MSDNQRMPAILPPIPTVTTIEEVIAAIDGIIAWSVANRSRLGYFAALYKRITKAIKLGIADHLFDDGPRMERLDVIFASRYFAALNGYFHGGHVSRCWRVAFDGAALPEPMVIQQMIAGVNAHIDLDLGIAAATVSPGAQLPSLQHDFDTVNTVLANQVSTVVTEIDEISPVLAEIYTLLRKHELDLIADGLVIVRNRAWAFAKHLAEEPEILHHATIEVHDAEVALLGELILHPPGLLETIATVIGAKESRDVVRNIEVLNAVAERLGT